jgi:hypothetical protein
MRVAIRPEKDVMKAENRAIMPKAITRIASHVVPYFLRMRLEGISAAVYSWIVRSAKDFASSGPYEDVENGQRNIEVSS